MPVAYSGWQWHFHPQMSRCSAGMGQLWSWPGLFYLFTNLTRPKNSQALSIKVLSSHLDRLDIELLFFLELFSARQPSHLRKTGCTGGFPESIPNRDPFPALRFNESMIGLQSPWHPVKLLLLLGLFTTVGVLWPVRILCHCVCVCDSDVWWWCVFGEVKRERGG